MALAVWPPGQGPPPWARALAGLAKGAAERGRTGAVAIARAQWQLLREHRLGPHALPVGGISAIDAQSVLFSLQQSCQKEVRGHRGAGGWPWACSDPTRSRLRSRLRLDRARLPLGCGCPPPRLPPPTSPLSTHAGASSSQTAGAKGVGSGAQEATRPPCAALPTSPPRRTGPPPAVSRTAHLPRPRAPRRYGCARCSFVRQPASSCCETWTRWTPRSRLGPWVHVGGWRVDTDSVMVTGWGGGHRGRPSHRQKGSPGAAPVRQLGQG